MTLFAALHHFPRESDWRAVVLRMRTADECPTQEELRSFALARVLRVLNGELRSCVVVE